MSFRKPHTSAADPQKMKNRLNPLFILILFLGHALHAESVPAVPKQPNIVIIYVDDLARGDVGAFGCPDPGTENIDRLAEQGVKLTNAYTNNAPCCPSRTAVMMGMYTQRFGKYGLSRGVPIPEDKPTMAETLRDVGYMTGIVGLEKWDIGRWDQGALDEGFMEAGMQPPRVPKLNEQGYGQRSWQLDLYGRYGTEVEGDYCVDFIKRHANGDKPFFLYYVPLAVHTPLHEVPEKYLDQLYPNHEGKYSPRQLLRANLLCLDLQVGRILQTLRDTGVAKDTLIVFSSDNGGDPGAGHRPLPFRGGKGGKNRYNLQWEGNYRMPTILSFPGRLPEGKVYDGMSGTLDFYATFAAAAGAERPEHIDGENLLPLLTGEKATDPDKAYFWNTHGSEIVRWQQWRLVKFRDAPWRLYDIEIDPSETRNLADRYPEIAAQLEQRYADWLDEMAPPAKPVRPPEALIPHTNGGHHARRPFGRGWMTAVRWEQINDDPSQWSETAARKRFFEAIEL
jgi:arylsulfatase A-like enzyme